MRIYIIAEIGINHNGSLDMALQLIDAAKEAGCDAVKFQARTIELVYAPEELSKPRASVFGATNGDLKRGLEFSIDQFRAIDRYCADHAIRWSASCWDVQSVDRIAAFAPPWLKIPSALITNERLLLAYRSAHVPLLVSTGMSTWEEIDRCVEVLRDAEFGSHKDPAPAPVTLLHCHSSYPSPLDEINLACINSVRERYPWARVGYSSHTVSPWPCLMAAVYGAEVIEFHLTLDRAMWGSDQAASLEPAAAKKLVQEIRTWEQCKGDGVKRVYASEIPIREKLRR